MNKNRKVHGFAKDENQFGPTAAAKDAERMGTRMLIFQSVQM